MFKKIIRENGWGVHVSRVGEISGYLYSSSQGKNYKKIKNKKKTPKKLLVQRVLQVCNGQSFIIFTILFNAHNMQTAYVYNKTMHRKLK